MAGIFNTFCGLWILSTSFLTLSTNRNIDSSAKFFPPRSLRCGGHRETHSSEPVNKDKNLPVFIRTSLYNIIYIYTPYPLVGWQPYRHLWTDCLDKMWEPLPLTTLWSSKACYRDSFTFVHYTLI
jgi:hypothetical protein